MIRCTFACVVTLAWASIAAAQTARPSRPVGKDKPAIQQAIDALIVEAEQARADQKLPRIEADFAATFEADIPDADVLKALVQPVHRQPFVDAYVRWQLTSFNPPLPTLDDRQFLKLMSQAPALLANPCAETSVVEVFEKAEDAASISPRDLERLRETWSRLNRERQVIETLNAPALQWRTWIDNQLPARGPRKVQWLIERAASTVSAGWDARDIKGDLTRSTRDLGRSVGDLALTPQQTALVCEQIQRLKGLRRRMIDDMAVLATGRVDVSFSNAYVSDSDIEKWVEALGGTVQS